MTVRPLDDLEMFDLLQAAYPEKFKDDDNETWEPAQELADELCGFDDLADLLGRVVMLTMPIESPLTKKFVHCLGEVSFVGNRAQMTAAVKRDVEF